MRTDREMAERHRYRLPDGSIAVNVTAISGLLDDGKSAGMAGAAARLTREGIDFRAEWRAAADTGTRVHSVCERWLLGAECFVEDRDAGYVDALEKFFIEHAPEKIEVEFICLSARGYGGRSDMIARLKDGRVLLIDLKSGKRHAIEHTLQLSAYRYADGIATYGDDGQLSATLRPLPVVDGCACLYVASDGTYSLVEYPADEEAFARFLGLLDAYRWTRSETMQKAKGER